MKDSVLKEKKNKEKEKPSFVYNYKKKFEVKIKITVFFYDQCVYFAAHIWILKINFV